MWDRKRGYSGMGAESVVLSGYYLSGKNQNTIRSTRSKTPTYSEALSK